jgi:hypothetical protein
MGGPGKGVLRARRRWLAAALILGALGFAVVQLGLWSTITGRAVKPKWTATGADAQGEVSSLREEDPSSEATGGDAHAGPADSAGTSGATSSTSASLWRTDDAPPPPMPGTLNGHVSALRSVHVDRDALAQIDVDSRVTIELPNGRTYVARVERIEAHDNGDRSWTGHLDEYGLTFPVAYTQGDPWVFATITSPEGLFALEANAEGGVIFRDERAALQHSDRDCVLLPD